MPAQTRVTEHLAELPWFNPDTIRCQDLQLINAPRGSGKSTLLFHWILHMAPKIVTPLVVSHTESATHWFENKVKIPRQFIWLKFSDFILANIFQRQLTLKTNPPPGYSIDVHGFLHLFCEDVIAGSGSTFRSDWFNHAVKNGRHSMFGMTILSQYLTGIPKDNRSQFERVALLHDPSGSNRQFAHENFFGSLSWEVFNYYYEKVTENNGVLIYSGTGIGPRYSRFRANINYLNEAESIDINWHPASTFKIFAQYFPIEEDTEYNVDYSKSQFGLASVLPGLLREPIGKKRK